MFSLIPNENTSFWAVYPLHFHRFFLHAILSLSHFGSGSGLFRKFGSLKKALKFAYPDDFWEETDSMETYQEKKKSQQRWLRLKALEIFPENTEIFEDFLHPDLIWGAN